MARKGRTAWCDAMIGRIGVVSHNLQSLLGAIKLTFLHVFICGVEYFDVQIRETLSSGFDLHASLKNVTNFLQGIK